MKAHFRERIHTAQTEHEQEVAELKAQVEYWRSVARNLASQLSNVAAGARKLAGLADRIVEEALE